MNKEYYLIPKELIDSRIEGLNKRIDEIKYLEGWLANKNQEYINKDSKVHELQSLTQQSKLVELSGNKINDLIREFLHSQTKQTFESYVNNEGYKLIKTITK